MFQEQSWKYKNYGDVGINKKGNGGEREEMGTTTEGQRGVSRVSERRNYTGTLYLLFKTLVIPSLITKSKYHIQRYKNKTATVVVSTVSIHTVLSPIYIYIYKKCTFTFT